MWHIPWVWTNTCAQHCNSLESSSTAPNVLPAALAHPSRPQTLATTGLAVVYVGLPFPECRTVGIMQTVAFSH